MSSNPTRRSAVRLALAAGRGKPSTANLLRGAAHGALLTTAALAAAPAAAQEPPVEELNPYFTPLANPFISQQARDAIIAAAFARSASLGPRAGHLEAPRRPQERLLHGVSRRPRGEAGS